jgi:phospholipase C
MLRPKIVLLLSVIIGLAAFLISLNSCGGGSAATDNPPPPPAPAGKINHVVIIFQENRTPDNLFQDPVLINRGADIASSGLNSQNQKIALTPVSLVTPYDLRHTHRSFLLAWNNGMMNGADQIEAVCADGTSDCAPAANPQYQYVQPSDVQPYFTLAETYTFGDRMFQSNQGPSFPAHQYIVSGTSAVSEKSVFDVANNPANDQQTAGCIAPPGATVGIIDTTDPNPDTNLTQTIYPCIDHPTLTDLLDARSISWKYYAPLVGSIWTAPNGIEHMCGPDAPPPNGTSCVGAEWTNHVVIGKTNVLDDIAAGNLAAVSWVIPTGKASDHARSTDGTGPSWVASIVNAIGTSQYWADTAIIITWDDWGGWYDHVPPPLIHNSYEIGLRVPLIVVSPYAKAGYISHVNHDFGSILKFIEKTFGLPEIDPAVGYADSRADDLSDCFDLSQTPLPFKSIPAPHDAQYFLRDKSPADPPDDD